MDVRAYLGEKFPKVRPDVWDALNESDAYLDGVLMALVMSGQITPSDAEAIWIIGKENEQCPPSTSTS